MCYFSFFFLAVCVIFAEQNVCVSWGKRKKDGGTCSPTCLVRVARPYSHVNSPSCNYWLQGPTVPAKRPKKVQAIPFAAVLLRSPPRNRRPARRAPPRARAPSSVNVMRDLLRSAVAAGPGTETSRDHRPPPVFVSRSVLSFLAGMVVRFGAGFLHNILWTLKVPSAHWYSRVSTAHANDGSDETASRDIVAAGSIQSICYHLFIIITGIWSYSQHTYLNSYAYS